MTAEELRDDVLATIRRHDHDADDLRDIAERLERMAERYEIQEEAW